jgi:general secretion pathway protein J
VNRHASVGMTLIEVLVALALLSLLAAGMFSAFQFAQRSYRQVTRVDADFGDVVVTQRFLRRVVESAYPFERDAGSQSAFHGLQGSRSRMLFTAPMPLGAGARGHYRYEIAVKAAADGSQALVVRSRLDRNGATPRSTASQQKNMHEEVLIQRIQSVEFGYLDPVQLQWQSAWQSKRTLPKLVRLRVLFGPNDPRRWPDLIIAPRLTDDANCAFDIISRACREVGT